MINLIGKTLVVFNVALSLVIFTFAVGIYTNRIDWGWKEPRQEFGTRVPSEIDKRTAEVKALVRMRDQVESALDQAQQQAAKNEEDWADSYLNQVQTLAEAHKSFLDNDNTQRKQQDEADELTKQIKTETDKLTKVSNLISGEHDKDKKTKPGLLDLLEEEILLQKQLRQEIATVEPLWVRKLVESQVLISRRQALELRLDELAGKMTEKKP